MITQRSIYLNFKLENVDDMRVAVEAFDHLLDTNDLIGDVEFERAGDDGVYTVSIVESVK